MLVRLKFRCWNEKCAHDYEMTREIEGRAQIIVACPYCGVEGVVDLDPYRDPTVIIYKGADETEQTAPGFRFPPVIPTRAPDADAPTVNEFLQSN